MSDPLDRLASSLADRYRIVRELGQGGMATVYLAEDLKHTRQVAIKVLRPELAAVVGAERFVQEITTTAQLQHPNILPLFDSGSADGFLYYVMPYVEGETLRAKLDRETQLGVDESVKLVSEVADALQYAHEHGVVHRDIKPENILLHASRPMVADFGIALAVSAAAGGRMTETGLSLGTPNYMSPEQATAERNITARSDIYSLASVLYEMLTGNPAHTGSSAQQIIMRIIADEVRPVDEIRKTVPSSVAAAVAKALEKLPADRFETARAFAEALAGRLPVAARELSGHAAREERGRPVLRLSRRATALVGSGIVALGILAVWGWVRPSPAPPVRWDTVTLGLRRLSPDFAVETAIAPDGSAIVFLDSLGPNDFGLTIKERNRPDPRLLVDLGFVRNMLGPAFSPDGRWIAYTDGKLEKVARTGGAPVALSDSIADVGATWLDDGTIAFIGDGGHALFRTSATGGSTTRVFSPDSGDMERIAPVPGGEAVLIGVVVESPFGSLSPREIAVNLKTGTVHQLTRGPLGAWIVPRDILVYGRPNGSLVAVPFDRRTLTIGGPPVPILNHVATTLLNFTEAVFGANGTLLYAEQERPKATGMELVSVSRDGAAAVLDSAWHPVIGAEGGIDLSPDGSRLALSVSDSNGGRSDIYTLRLPAGPPVRLTFGGTSNIRPRWSPDGRTILYASDAGGGQYGLWTKRADGSGQATPVKLSETRPVWEGTWSPNGKWLVYRTDNAAKGNGDILAVKTNGDTTTIPLVATDAEEFAPTLSPDGRWMAYVSRANGRNEVYVRPFPDADAGGPWQVSNDYSGPPRWSHDGTAIFYRNGHDDMIEAQVSLQPTFVPGKHQVLFNTFPFVRLDLTHEFALSRDNDRFLMVKYGLLPRNARLVLVGDWMPELRQKLKAGGGS